jgi:hypothetical protein
MASKLERTPQADTAGFNCLLAGVEFVTVLDGCKNITMIFFRSRMLVDEAQAH